MPNWCHNSLTVEGPQKELDRFSEQACAEPSPEAVSQGFQEQPLSFNNFLPMPEDEEDGYSWHVISWGTKWDAVFNSTPMLAMLTSENAEPFAEQKQPEPETNRLTYQFETAWSPPLEAIQTISEMYPELTFTLDYGEPGNDFGGISIFSNGREIDAIQGFAEDFLERSQLWF